MSSRGRCVAFAGLGLAVTLLPWIVPNLLRFEHPVTLSNGFGHSISAGSCDATWGDGPYLGWYICGYQEDADATTVTWNEQGPVGPPIEGDESVRDAERRRLALDYVGDHLGRLPAVAAARVGRLWYLFRPSQTADFDGVLEGRGIGMAEAARWATYALVPVAIGGLVVLRRRRVTILPFVVLVVAATLAAAATFGLPRYRVPADVGLVVAAGVGLDALWRRLRPPAEDPAAPVGTDSATPARAGGGAAAGAGGHR